MYSLIVGVNRVLEFLDRGHLAWTTNKRLPDRVFRNNRFGLFLVSLFLLFTFRFFTFVRLGDLRGEGALGIFLLLP